MYVLGVRDYYRKKMCVRLVSKSGFVKTSRIGTLEKLHITVETQYNEILGTRKFCLLYQIFYIGSP